MCDTIHIRFEQGRVGWSLPDGGDENLERVAEGVVQKINEGLGEEMFSDFMTESGDGDNG